MELMLKEKIFGWSKIHGEQAGVRMASWEY